MPFTDPYKPQDQIEQVRKVGRLAQIILDIRAEYEHRPRPDLLNQLVTRIAELDAVRGEIAAHLGAPPAPEEEGAEPEAAAPAEPDCGAGETRRAVASLGSNGPPL